MIVTSLFLLLLSLPSLLLSLSCGFEADWNHKSYSLSFVPAKLAKLSGANFSKIQLDIAEIVTKWVSAIEDSFGPFVVIAGHLILLKKTLTNQC